MSICILDGKAIEDKEMLHDALAGSLGFPDWYGRNLDALHDCLTDMREESEIRLRNESALIAHLGSYAAALSKVIVMAAEENGRIKYIIEE